MDSTAPRSCSSPGKAKTSGLETPENSQTRNRSAGRTGRSRYLAAPAAETPVSAASRGPPRRPDPTPSVRSGAESGEGSMQRSLGSRRAGESRVREGGRGEQEEEEGWEC